MAIASICCSTLQLISEKADLTEKRMYIDARRQTLSSKISSAYSDYTETYSRMHSLKDDEEGNKNDQSVTFNEEQFQREYDAMMDDLERQDKALEMERTNMNTRIEAITTMLEGTEKRLNKNIENDFKGNN